MLLSLCMCMCVVMCVHAMTYVSLCGPVSGWWLDSWRKNSDGVCFRCRMSICNMWPRAIISIFGKSVRLSRRRMAFRSQVRPLGHAKARSLPVSSHCVCVRGVCAEFGKCCVSVCAGCAWWDCLGCLCVIRTTDVLTVIYLLFFRTQRRGTGGSAQWALAPSSPPPPHP